MAEQIWRHAPGKEKLLSLDFIFSLTKAQLGLFADVSVRADGCIDGGRSFRIWQKHRKNLDTLQLVCSLLGKQTSLGLQTNGWCLSVYERNRIIPASATRRGKISRVGYEGRVWCPTTDTGTWLARRSGTVYFTGNTDHVSKSIRLAELQQWSRKAQEFGKRFIMPIRFWPRGQQGPHDYVLLSLDDFAELLSLIPEDHHG